MLALTLVNHSQTDRQNHPRFKMINQDSLDEGRSQHHLSDHYYQHHGDDVAGVHGQHQYHQSKSKQHDDLLNVIIDDESRPIRKWPASIMTRPASTCSM